MIHNGSIHQKDICLANNNKILICSNIEQRQRIIGTLKNLNVPISKYIYSDTEVTTTWPSLMISRGYICGYKNIYGHFLSKYYTEMTEREFIDLFIINKFDIYGNLIINKNWR